MINSRQITYDALVQVFKNKGYSNIVLDTALSNNILEKKQSAFVSRLFYGVLERKITLDYVIKKYSQKPLSKLDKEVLIILEIGIYQLLYLESVPDNSAVDETVKLVSYARKASAKGFVNAVLRSFLRDEKKIDYPDKESQEFEYLCVFYSCPIWLLKQWQRQYDMETAIELAKASIQEPPLTVRVNTLKTTPQKLIGYLENRGVSARQHSFMKNCLILNQSGSIKKLPQYKQGLFHVQDISSQICACAVDAKPNHTVLDVCAAPGSKSFTIAQTMENQGEIYDFDLYEHKLSLIKDSAKRLGISVIKTSIQDGATFNDEIPLADRVLCDVPCSGLGIIRRKPEIKYKDYSEFEDLPQVQYSILKNAANYVKEGGRLIYSTCTTNKKENEEIVHKFLLENSAFKLLKFSHILSKIESIDANMITLLPHKNQSDGFFIAILEKLGD